MKKVILLLSLIVLCCGCGEKKNEENPPEDNSVKEEKNNTYDIENFQKIKEVSDCFLNDLKSANIRTEPEYLMSKYSDKDYQIVDYNLSNDEKITMKFDNEENLLGITLVGNHDNVSLNFINTRLAISNFKYINLSAEEKENIKPFITGVKTTTNRAYEKINSKWSIHNSAKDSEQFMRIFAIILN